jgi:hypothetical protein
MIGGNPRGIERKFLNNHLTQGVAMTAKCPHCQSNITSLQIIPVTGSSNVLETYKCILLCCQSCNVAVSAQIDPIAIKTDIKNAILNRN